MKCLSEPDYKPDYRHRPHMNGTTFKMNGKSYRILEGIFIGAEHGIKFELIAQPSERDEPTVIYRMRETEFFAKVIL